MNKTNPTHNVPKLRAGERIERCESVRQHKNGQRLDISLTISPVRNRDGASLPHLAADYKMGWGTPTGLALR
jgi:hypothetical protein